MSCDHALCEMDRLCPWIAWKMRVEVLQDVSLVRERASWTGGLDELEVRRGCEASAHLLTEVATRSAAQSVGTSVSERSS